MTKKIGKFLIVLVIISLVLPIFSFAQEVVPQEPPIKAPGTVEEAIGMLKKASQKVLEIIPEAIKEIWHKKVLPVWKKMWDWSKNVWENYIKKPLHDFWYYSFKPKIQSFLQEIKEFLGKEVEEKKPVIKEEFRKEKEEMQEEIPRTTKSLWQRFKDLLE